MGAVLYDQLIGGDRDHGLPPRPELVRSRILREDFWSNLHTADQMYARAFVIADVFQDHHIRNQRLIRPQSNSLRKDLGGIEHPFKLPVSEVTPPEPCGDSHGFSFKIASHHR